MIFPEHYSETAIAVLSIPGWEWDYGYEDGTDSWKHQNDTHAVVDTDGTISTYPPVEGDDGVTDYWSPTSPAYAF
jgi:hypothetical protein